MVGSRYWPLSLPDLTIHGRLAKEEACAVLVILPTAKSKAFLGRDRALITQVDFAFRCLLVDVVPPVIVRVLI